MSKPTNRQRKRTFRGILLSTLVVPLTLGCVTQTKTLPSTVWMSASSSPNSGNMPAIETTASGGSEWAPALRQMRQTTAPGVDRSHEVKRVSFNEDQDSGVMFASPAATKPDAELHDDGPVVLGQASAIQFDAASNFPTVDPLVLDVDETTQTIDLASALGMAGGNAWTIQLARQRTIEAHADVIAAKALWLPTLQVGLGWNKHDGRIQATEGQVVKASRNSFFLGGGATLGNAPVAGGSGGPLRLSSDLALVDAYFASTIAERRLCAERFGVSVARNTALLKAGLAYADLLESAGRVADAQAAVDATTELVKLTEAFEEAGAGAAADVDRAKADRARLSLELQDARRTLRTRSATLARWLRLDPRLQLQPADQVLVPIQLCSVDSSVDGHIATATASRPEFAQLSNHIAAGCLEVRKAEVEPWVPKLAMATSAGSFGGGTGSTYDNNGGRSDIDIQAVWEIDSLGYGVDARRKRARSRVSQDRIRLADLRDEVTAQVVRAYEDLVNYSSQIQSADTVLELAESSYQKNLLRIRADEGLPIELLQAIQAKAAGLRARTTAVSAFNRAQISLLYATGQLLQ